MKKLILLALLVSLFSVNTKASHNNGGEITYEWVSGSLYNVTVKLYTDCSGVPPTSSIQIDYSSVSCGINQPRTLFKVSTRDVSQVCDTMLLACNGGTLPGVYETVYQGQITAISQCNDWVLSYNFCCRGIPTNISSPTANFYIETTFDNTTHLNNKSPYFADSPRWMVPVNGMNLINAGAYDPDGDSLHFSLVTPKDNNSTTIAYAAGYSATQPFGGSSTSIDPKTGIISTMAPTVGQFLIGVKVDEFRDGQLIGSTRRDFSTNVYVNSNVLPQISSTTIISNAALNVSGCSIDTLSLSIFSSDPTDTITTSILYPYASPGSGVPYFSNLASPPLNMNTDYLADTNTFEWDLAGLPEGEYVTYINVEENICSIRNIQSYAVVVNVSYCVWPGDANNDLVADVWDLLPIGVYNGSIGLVRPNATLNWEGQWSPSWGTKQASGDDLNHVDCNGDSIINANDTTAIMLNYNLTHVKSGSSISAGINDPDLFVGIIPDTVPTSTPLAIPIELGTALTPADSVYGVAMRISYDNKKIDSIAGVTVDYSNSWLGTEGVDMITLDTNFYDNGFIDIALVRTDGQMMNGFGELVTLNVITIDNLSGKAATYGALTVDFIKTTIIDINEMMRPHNTLLDSVVIKDVTTGITEALNENQVSISPNPSNGQFNINVNNNRNVTIEIYSALGQLVDFNKTQRNGMYQVSLKNQDKGMFIVRVKDEDNKSIVTKKIVVH
jgi:hypothetical protein